MRNILIAVAVVIAAIGIYFAVKGPYKVNTHIPANLKGAIGFECYTPGASSHGPSTGSRGIWLNLIDPTDSSVVNNWIINCNDMMKLKEQLLAWQNSWCPRGTGNPPGVNIGTNTFTPAISTTNGVVGVEFRNPTSAFLMDCNGLPEILALFDPGYNGCCL